MKRTLIIILLPLLLFSGCLMKKMTQLSESGKDAYAKENYEEALKHFQEVINTMEARNKKVAAEIFSKAGKAAYHLEAYNKSIQYLEKAIYDDYKEKETLFILAQSSKKTDNLSKEINALEEYINTYDGGKRYNKIQKRLFKTYVESENWNKAHELYPKLSDTIQNQIKEAYLVVNKNLDKEEVCDRLASEILRENPNNKEAMEWMAKKYYRQAEDRYQREMNAYENNKTRSQYNHLVKSLEEVTKDYKTSLKYFKKIYRITQNPKYARYLGNIYARLDNEQKARYYHKKAE